MDIFFEEILAKNLSKKYKQVKINYCINYNIHIFPLIMKIPYLKKKIELKSCHDVTWEDNYSWIHQQNILEVLKDKSKLDPEVKEYLDEENSYAEHHLKDTKNIQKKLFDEIKGRIKLDDESLPYKDHTYEYWTKTTTLAIIQLNLEKKLIQMILKKFGTVIKKKRS